MGGQRRTRRRVPPARVGRSRSAARSICSPRRWGRRAGCHLRSARRSQRPSPARPRVAAIGGIVTAVKQARRDQPVHRPGRLGQMHTQSARDHPEVGRSPAGHHHENPQLRQRDDILHRSHRPRAHRHQHEPRSSLLPRHPLQLRTGIHCAMRILRRGGAFRPLRPRDAVTRRFLQSFTEARRTS
jgi:hypothetical protein